MASFVEQATLVVNDQSSAQIKKINAALSSLFKTASSLKSVNINISVNDRGIQKAITNMRSLKREMDRMGGHGGATRLNVSVNTAGLSAAQRQISALRTQAQKPIAVTATPARAGVGGRPAGAVPVGLGRAAGVAGRGLLGGAGLGGIAGSAQATASLWALSAAAHAAGSALSSIAKNAMDRDRQTLASNVTATKAQQKIWEELGGRPKEAPGLISETGFRELRRSLLGDVPGTDEQKARGADTVARHLVNEVLPRIYAANPALTPEQAGEGLRKTVKSVNLSTGDLLKNNQLTEQAMRTFHAVATAQAADPELSPELVKTTLANLKSSAYSLDEQGLTRVLLNAGTRGARAANEQFQAQLAAGGTNDVKVLNNKLAELGLLMDPQRNKKGNVLAGTGTPKDNLLLQQDPGEWFNKYFTPKMNAALKAKGVDEDSPQYNAEAKSYIERAFPGMRQTAKQAISDLVLGYKQTMASIATGKTATGTDVKGALDKSTKAQVDMLQTAWKDAGATIGENLQQVFPGLPDAIKGLTGLVEQHPLLAGAAAVGAPLVGAGAMMAAGPLLSSAAYQLMGAAGALRGAAVVGGAAGVGGAVAGGAAAAAGGGIAGLLQRLPLILRASIVGALAYALYRTVKPTPAGGPSADPNMEKTKKGLEDQYKTQIALQGAIQERDRLEASLASGSLKTAGEIALAQAYLEKLNAEIKTLQATADAAQKAVQDDIKAENEKIAANKRVAEAFDALGIKPTEEPKPRPFPQPLAKPTELEKQRLKALEDVQREAEQRRTKIAEQEARDTKQRDRQRGDPSDIWKNVPPEWKKPPPIYPDGVPPGGPVKTMFDQPIPIKTDQPIPVTIPKPEWAPAPAAPGGPYPGGVPADVGAPITTLPEINVAPISEAISSGITQGAPALSEAMTGALSTISSTFQTAIAPLESAGSNLASSLQTGASSIQSAATEVAGSGSKAAGALQSAAPGIGSAIGAAAANAIRGATANVTISVQHSGNTGGGGSTGNSAPAP